MVLSAPSPGAEISTRFEPFSRWGRHFSLEVKIPVHSITTSTSAQGRSAGFFNAVTIIGPRPTSIQSAPVVTVAGGFDHDVHRAACNRSCAVVGEGRPRDPLSIPADRAARLAGAVTVEIDDDGHLEAWRVRHLRQEHRTEFAGADQCDANRFAGCRTRPEEVMEVHGACPLQFACPGRGAA